MTESAYTSGSSWSWPKESPLTDSRIDGAADANHEFEAVPGTSMADEDAAENPSKDGNEENQAPKPERHYPSRTCRICLEVVHPTFTPPGEGFGRVLYPTSRVAYISEDPEAGRLIRPCKCKGSQRYVHEGCLQAWRHADPVYGRRNFWECPTCKFRYHLERMRMGRWISSTLAQVFLTLFILFLTIFVLGFVADPIISLYLDPVGTITTNPLTASPEIASLLEDEDGSWIEHLLKGLASLGLLGFIRVILMSPWQWFHIRNSGLLGAGTRNGRNATGRDRMESISWSLVMVGVFTFLWAVWKVVRAWSRRALEKAGERVFDVQGDDDIDDDSASNSATDPPTG